MNLYVRLVALEKSAQVWEDAGETVRGASKSLADVDANLLGERVAGAATTFIETWMTEIKRLQSVASDHGDALRETVLLYGQADGDSLERSQQLMVWTE